MAQNVMQYCHVCKSQTTSGPPVVPGKHFGLRVVKPLQGTPGRGHNSRPKYCANRESVPFTLDEAIFEVASEAISK